MEQAPNERLAEHGNQPSPWIYQTSCAGQLEDFLMINAPVTVYINWAAYDELSDSVPLTETLAMRQLGELLRLRAAGVRLDGYVMDAFWYQPDGAYREWRKPHWPEGPDRWLAGCQENGVTPGLWFSGNSLCKLELAPEWKGSFDPEHNALCLFHGGFLPHWMETVRHWHERGVRIFKLDFFQFQAAPEIIQRRCCATEIRTLNIEALRRGLGVLHDECPDIMFLGYNGLEEGDTQSRTDIPFRKTIDHRWLDVFDSIYCGDPRPADVPAMNFWRAKDVYSDHMVSVYERNGIPLGRIDNSGFMIGVTGTCYHRGTAAWKGMLALSLARGGWVNTYYGNLELLDAEDARWFAKVQAMYLRMQAFGRLSTFGAIPGEGRPYGYLAEDAEGALLTVVNPAQAVETLPLPLAAAGRILFQDDGFTPTLREGCLTLGPEQMAVVGVGRYAASAFDLGRQTDVSIPLSLDPIPAEFQELGGRVLTATLIPPADGRLRVVLRQFGRDGHVKRSSGGAPPGGAGLAKLLSLELRQGDRSIPARVNYDKAIWSGLSWAVAEFELEDFQAGKPVTVRCFSMETAEVTLRAELFHVG